MDSVAGTLLIAVYVAVPGVLAAAAMTRLAQRSAGAVVAGLALLAVTAILPLMFGYGLVYGVAGALLGGLLAAIHAQGRKGWRHTTLLVAALLSLVAIPAALLEAGRIQADENYARCAGDKAVAIIEQSRTGGHGYPATFMDVSIQDHSYYGPGSCVVGNGTNWLYRVDVNGLYAVGYWVDWRIARRVCIHSAGTKGWSCGFERWEPFLPEARDQLAIGA